MHPTLTIAAAQFPAVKGDIAANLATHCTIIEAAARYNPDVLLFPELSLSGYEPQLAETLALGDADDVWNTLQTLSTANNITLLVGAPHRSTKERPQLGLAVLFPAAPMEWYHKIHLHGVENDFFTPGTDYKQITCNNVALGLAICADTSDPSHPTALSELGAAGYLASMVVSKKAYATDVAMLTEYAQQHAMPVGMANLTDRSGPFQCAGGSVIIGQDGTMLAQGDTRSTGFALATVPFITLQDENLAQPNQSSSDGSTGCPQQAGTFVTLA